MFAKPDNGTIELVLNQVDYMEYCAAKNAVGMECSSFPVQVKKINVSGISRVMYCMASFRQRQPDVQNPESCIAVLAPES